ncbi:metallopeptidase TldD-related protein [Streptomyces sp. NPDC001107]
MTGAFWERREDQSVRRTATTARAGQWTLGPAAHRRTLHWRGQRNEQVGWLIRTDEVTPQPDGVTAPLPTEALETLAEGDGWPLADAGHQLSLTHIVGTRNYENSESVSQAVGFDEWHVAGAMPDTGDSVQCVVTDPERLADAAVYVGERLLAQHHVPGPVPAPARSQQAVLLEPPVAAALIHELVGHALEERHVLEGERILPHGCCVTTSGPAGRPLDDEGVTSDELVLVEDGVVVASLADRMTRPEHRGTPSGQSWAGLHHARPTVRLTHLKAEWNTRGSAELRSRMGFIRCHAIRGARYVNGFAVLDVARANRVSNTTIESPVSLRLIIDHSQLSEAIDAHHLAAPVRFDPVGRCVKEGDALPSIANCPALLLPQVTALGAP